MLRAVSNGGTRYFSQSEFAMKALAQETGARAFFPATIADLASVYGIIAEELATQYALGSTSKNPKRDGAFRRVARLGDGWHASSMDQASFRQGKEGVLRFWKEAGREGEPVWSLRIPILLDGVHRAAVDMSLLRGRHTLAGSPAKVAEELRGFQALGVSHVALEVSYSTYPAILETIDLIADQIRPALSSR